MLVVESIAPKSVKEFKCGVWLYGSVIAGEDAWSSTFSSLAGF
jgi:hypothetical protein